MDKSSTKKTRLAEYSSANNDIALNSVEFDTLLAHKINVIDKEMQSDHKSSGSGFSDEGTVSKDNDVMIIQNRCESPETILINQGNYTIELVSSKSFPNFWPKTIKEDVSSIKTPATLSKSIAALTISPQRVCK